MHAILQLNSKDAIIRPTIAFPKSIAYELLVLCLQMKVRIPRQHRQIQAKSPGLRQAQIHGVDEPPDPSVGNGFNTRRTGKLAFPAATSCIAPPT